MKKITQIKDGAKTAGIVFMGEGYTTGAGLWSETWGGWPNGLVNQRTVVLANICEVKAPENVADCGKAFVAIGQIVPGDDNTVTVFFLSHLNEPVEYRIHLVVCK